MKAKMTTMRAKTKAKTTSDCLRIIITHGDGQPPRIFERSVEAPVDDVAAAISIAIAAFDEALSIELSGRVGEAKRKRKLSATRAAQKIFAFCAELRRYFRGSATANAPVSTRQLDGASTVILRPRSVGQP